MTIFSRLVAPATSTAAGTALSVLVTLLVAFATFTTSAPTASAQALYPHQMEFDWETELPSCDELLASGFLTGPISQDLTQPLDCNDRPAGPAVDSTHSGDQVTLSYNAYYDRPTTADTTWLVINEPLMTPDGNILWGHDYGTIMSQDHDPHGGHQNPFNGTPLDVEMVAQASCLQTDLNFSSWENVWEVTDDHRHLAVWTSAPDTIRGLVPGAHCKLRFGFIDPSRDYVSIDVGFNRFYQYRASRSNAPPVYVAVDTAIESDPETSRPISVYPNPAVSWVKIEGAGASPRWRVHDLLGRQVGEDQVGVEVSVRHLAPGIYVLLVEDRLRSNMWTPVRFTVVR